MTLSAKGRAAADGRGLRVMLLQVLGLALFLVITVPTVPLASSTTPATPRGLGENVGQSCDSLLRVTYQCTEDEIIRLINSSTDQHLKISLFPIPGYFFNIGHLTALLTTRKTNIEVTAFSAAGVPECVFDCSESYLNLSQRISVAGYQSVALIGMHLHGCQISISDSENVTLDGIYVTGNHATDMAEIGVVNETSCPNKHQEDMQAVAGTEAAIAFLNNTNVTIVRTHFTNNWITPLKIVDSVVSVEYCIFRENTVDGSLQSRSEDGLPIRVPISAGVAISHREDSEQTDMYQDVMAPTVSRLQVSFTGCTFRNNTLYGDINFTDSQVLADFKKPAGAAGAAMQVLLATEYAPPAQIDVVSSHFVGNRIILCNIPLFLTHTGGGLEGGAVSVRFDESESAASVVFLNCTWMGNVALRGGAVSVSFYGDVGDNSVRFSNSSFKCNTASALSEEQLWKDDTLGFGGALNIEYHGSGLECNSVEVMNNTEFISNLATEGGAVHIGYYQPYRNNSMPTCKQIGITAVTFEMNKAMLGAAISMWGGDDWRIAQEQSPINTATNGTEDVIVQDCVFQHNVAFWRGTFVVTNLQMALDGTNTFHHNRNSALVLLSARLWLKNKSKVVFEKNNGEVGAGLLMQESHIVVGRDSEAYFLNNVALSKGGGMFASLSLT